MSSSAPKEKEKKDRTLPNTPGFSYIYVDMRENYDEKLLTRFYNDLMVPNFPISDELDPLEKWVELLSPFKRSKKGDDEGEEPDFHVLMLLKQEDKASTFDDAQILGGVVFEYYSASNTGLLTYLLVASKFRGYGIGQLLSTRCRDVLETNAKSRGHLAGCNAIFLETNSASKVQESEDVMNPAMRHEIFYKMGLRLVDFDYVQAPLFRGKKKVNYLLLCVFLSERIPKQEDTSREGGGYYLPSALLKNTIRAFWISSSQLTNYKWAEDVDFQRMMDQLSRRERISLLDLPWERPFTIVDLREHFDLELLVQFYQDLLVPSFVTRKDELDPLELWITMLAPSSKLRLRASDTAVAAGDQELLHLLLALKYSEDELEYSKPMIAGGLAFEYYPNNNCGLLTYLLTPPNERGARMARALIDQALELLDADARRRGHLGGCNVIFMEASTDFNQLSSSSSSSGSASATDVTDLTLQHAMMEKMGWKMLDFEYIQPPFIDISKKKMMNLMVFVTGRIPKLSQEDSHYLFLPRSTVKNFIAELWAANCNRLNYQYSSDLQYRRMMTQLDRREKIPLLARSEGRPWTLVDLCDDYDPDTVKRYYHELIQPNLKTLEQAHVAQLTLEEWMKHLSPEETKRKAAHEDHHALLALRSGADSAPTLLGGLTFNYFVVTNCGLITSALVKKLDGLQEQLAKALVERAVDILDQNAVSRGHLIGCNAIFLETRETGPNQLAIPQADVSMDISRQHQLLEKMGWRLLDFNYVVPPPRADKPPIKGLSLSVFVTPRIPRVPYEQQGYEYHYMPKHIMKSFIEYLWRTTCNRIGYDYDQQPDFVKMMDLLERRERIPLLELPWERPWTLVDLWEDYDVELVYRFYQNFLCAAYPDKADREPLSNWLRSLTPLARANPDLEDFHMLLALNYSRQNVNHKPDILGGLLFTYHTHTNIGVITFLSVSALYGVIMARALIEEATEILVENAIARGHIAGCNAIFMEVPEVPPAGVSEQIVKIEHDLLHQMGWRLLDFAYTQPPLSISSTGGKPCLLLGLQTPNIPKDPSTGVPFVPKELVVSFVRTTWSNSYTNMGRLLSKDRTYQMLMTKLGSMEKVPLLDTPWKYPTPMHPAPSTSTSLVVEPKPKL